MKPWQTTLWAMLLSIPVGVGLILGAYGLWWFPLLSYAIVVSAMMNLFLLDRPWDRFNVPVRAED